MAYKYLDLILATYQRCDPTATAAESTLRHHWEWRFVQIAPCMHIRLVLGFPYLDARFNGVQGEISCEVMLAQSCCTTLLCPFLKAYRTLDIQHR